MVLCISLELWIVHLTPSGGSINGLIRISAPADHLPLRILGGVRKTCSSFLDIYSEAAHPKSRM